MKQLPIIVLTLALCLLTAGCGAKQTSQTMGTLQKQGLSNGWQR